jgi:hypothetical protein
MSISHLTIGMILKASFERVITGYGERGRGGQNVHLIAIADLAMSISKTLQQQPG